MTDRGERWKGEQELEGFFSLSFDLLSVSKDGYFQKLNRAWESVLGFTSYELMSRPVVNFVHPKDLPKAEAMKAEIEQGKSVNGVEFRLLCKNGTYKTLVWNAALSPNGECVYAAARVTETKEMEEKVHQLNAELKARLKDVIALDKELDAFSYSVSHALRAPVRDMEGFADLLNKHCSAVLDAEGRRYINAISGSAKKMGRLMDDLLGFSRMGKAELKKTRIHLNSLISEVLGEIAPIHEGRRIDWKIGKLPEVYADREMLRLVFVNLLSNAVKYTGQRETAIVEINGYANGSNELIFYVRDNGVGFDMNYVDKLFQVFHRLHGNVEFEGTGIGLANVRRIIHRHRGRTWAEGTVNKGATFYFSLPGEIQD